MILNNDKIQYLFAYVDYFLYSPMLAVLLCVHSSFIGGE